MTKKFNPQDSYFKQAKQEGYLARSVYKLIEIDKKFRVFKQKQSVLDLGCSPGSWMQYIVKKTNGKCIGVDLKETVKIEGASCYVCDAFSDELSDILKKHNLEKTDCIVSDMAPKTTGISDIDQYASVELNLQALDVCKKFLKKGGRAIFKIFRGEDFNDFWFEAKKVMPDIKTFKPKACRDRSFEIYCIGTKK